MTKQIFNFIVSYSVWVSALFLIVHWMGLTVPVSVATAFLITGLLTLVKDSVRESHNHSW